MRVDGAPSTLISPTEKVGKVELGNVRVERQKLGEGGEEVVRGCKTGTLSMVGGGGVGDWIWGAGSLFTFEGGSPWWRETLTHHAEQKTRKVKN